MKHLLILLATVSIGLTRTYAQDYRVKLTNSADKKVTFEMATADLRIEGHNDDDVVITASGYEAPPERAKGLRPLYNSAIDNTGIGLAVNATGGGLTIEKATRKEVTYTIRLPRKVAVLYQQSGWQGGDVKISNMDGDLELKTNNGNINLTRVTGPVVANSTSGEINVVYSTLNQDKPTAISTISGSVDVTMPASAKTKLHLRTISGEIYTDFDLDMKTDKNGMKRVGGQNNFDTTTNGGGVELKLSSISGDVFIRKQK